MRKTFVWALMAILAVAGSAFAGVPGGIVANATFPGGSPATTNNDDSCDISVAPAATLLLPYFEVAEDRAGETTLFTITNVSQYPQIAHVVLWTDFSYPVIDFNIYLTGYDVQSINLNDVIWQGIIAPPAGTGTVTTTGAGTGDFDEDEPGATHDFSDCGTLAGGLSSFYQTRMQTAFTLGTVAAVPGDPLFTGCNNVGNVHENAVGYATIDVVDLCSTGLPTDGDAYFLTEIRFDNVLIGDYQQVNSSQNFAQGNPMVHIRAIPEGPGDTQLPTNFDRTFYSRYQTILAPGVPNTLDRRQALPSTFAARWINGGSSGFETSFKIWREGIRTGTSCGTVDDNGLLSVAEIVAFDEAENGEGITDLDCQISPCIPGEGIILPETSNISLRDDDEVDSEDYYPQSTFDTDTAGWVYFNLHNNGPLYGEAAPTTFASQNWVIVSMQSEGRYSVDYDAAWLGNGCSYAVLGGNGAPITTYSGNGPALGTALTAGIILPQPAADDTGDPIP